MGLKGEWANPLSIVILHFVQDDNIQGIRLPSTTAGKAPASAQGKIRPFAYSLFRSYSITPSNISSNPLSASHPISSRIFRRSGTLLRISSKPGA